MKNTLLRLACLLAPAWLAAAEIDVTRYPVVFSPTEFPGGTSVHLPSLLVTRAGTVLAVCQLRKSSEQDWGHDIDLVLRRSLDGGRTWLPSQMAFALTGINAVNGGIVQDRATGQIFLPFRQVPSAANSESSMLAFVTGRGGSTWFITSRDEGKTWTSPQENEPVRPAGWSVWPANSSHGIQLASGRLVIGAFVHRARPGGPIRDLDFCSGLMLSDDHGRTWRLGATAPIYGTDEHAIAETSNGDIYDNIRLNNRAPIDHTRFYARSRDGGETYGETGLQEGMSLINCHVGLIRWRRDGRDLLLYTGPQGPNGHSHRSLLAIRVSYDGGRTWPVARIITGPGDSSEYSDLAVAPDGTVLCLYGEHTFEPEKHSVLRLIRLTVDEIERTYGPRSRPLLATP